MTTPETVPTAEGAPLSASSSFSQALRRLYFTRFAFAIVWAGLLFTTAKSTGPGLTALLVLYPLFDAGAVLWQIRADTDQHRSSYAQWINVAVSVVVAGAVGIASTSSIGASLVVWGAWAICSGIPQLITAIGNRRSGGQLPQIISGGVSILAGAAFLGQGAQGASSMAGAGGYAILGGVLFLISAIRLGQTARVAARR